MNKFENILETEAVIVGDGAMGTELQKIGLDSGEAPETWNLEQPEKIKKVHKSYIEAGADLIETNTFGGNLVRLKESGLGDSLKEINKNAVDIARTAANDDTIIAGSVGPTGKMIKPLGELSEKEARDSYYKQISVLVENKVDVILIETMVDLPEIEAGVKAASEFEIPVIAQMNFGESFNTVMGYSLQDLVDLGNKYENIKVIGINCTPGAARTLPMIQELHQITDFPLSVFPNAGEPYLEEGELLYPEGPEDFAPYVAEYLGNNIKIMGGCCGTNPEVIATISKEIKGQK